MLRKFWALCVISTLVLVIAASSGCFDSDDPPSLGDHAKNYLQGDKYKRVIVEIDYVEGYEPSMHALDTFKTRLHQYCDKPEGDLVIIDSIAASGTQYSDDDIRDLEEEHRDYHKTKSDIVVYVLYLDGEYKTDSNVLGIAYSPSSFTIFKEKIDSIPIPAWGPAIGLTTSDYETSVIVHEFGHLLSLVNIGYESEREHEDTGHDHHCTHEDCVMYYAIETVNIYNFVVEQETEPPSDFCSDCIHDLGKIKRGEY